MKMQCGLIRSERKRKRKQKRKRKKKERDGKRKRLNMQTKMMFIYGLKAPPKKGYHRSTPVQ